MFAIVPKSRAWMIGVGLSLLGGCDEQAEPVTPQQPLETAPGFGAASSGGAGSVAVGGTAGVTAVGTGGAISPPLGDAGGASFPVPPPPTFPGVVGGSPGCGFNTTGSVPGVDVGFAGSPSFMTTGSGSQAAVSLEKAPPPISGGTLLTTRDGKHIVAADPDRDLVYLVDTETESLATTWQLQAGDEPGRLVEDAAGNIHVALRGAGAVATLTLKPGDQIARRAVCDLPRGIAYDAAQDALHVGCAEGKLVTLPAAAGGAVTRTLDLGGDVRDVLVRDSKLFVSRYRSAELLTLDASGAIISRKQPPTFSQSETKFDQDPASASCGQIVGTENVESSPTLAWRMVDVPETGVAMLHQRAREGEVQVTQGGYGSGSGCAPGIVHGALSMGLDGTSVRSADIASLAVAVDLASDPDGVLLAAVGPGNWGIPGLAQVEVYRMSDLMGMIATPDNQPFVSCVIPTMTMPQLDGQVTAVTFSSPYILAVQSREPAAIDFIDLRTSQLRAHLDLKQESRFDTGHALFHTRAGAGLACASCHGEGGDDSHVWTFHGIGARRTQQLRGGILGTEPFHWNGDMQDFPTLVREVFVGRMQGTQPTTDQTDAMARWIDRMPELKLTAADASAATRGKALFETTAGCNECHAGEHLTNNKTVDVGTGVALQVPSLHDVALRSPLMHDGCAKTLKERFTVTSCGGGDKHGHTTQLSAAELDDLVAYVSTL